MQSAVTGLFDSSPEFDNEWRGTTDCGPYHLPWQLESGGEHLYVQSLD